MDNKISLSKSYKEFFSQTIIKIKYRYHKNYKIKYNLFLIFYNGQFTRVWLPAKEYHRFTQKTNKINKRLIGNFMKIKNKNCEDKIITF